MNDINKAQCWCNRLYKLMKEKNYTQKSFLKEYKEKYGGGTQANISRWLRVGSKIENGKTIGFPSYETMSNLADFLEYQ
ncbi:helix-turn-helix transcriptional regulator [Coprococcus sp. OM06-25]|uniref:helix-turn-helix transcriptional regulator n=1 Tax=Coprococcus sp. OM06-25 TaxID=2293094 RepID=UPI000E5D34CA|nr:helix-turn-helix transcriptional regulator [Coprococcus sp. OM06-25]RGI41963.1 XRE family transcriptional regulator [Coprococcus sp. OM06-25]